MTLAMSKLKKIQVSGLTQLSAGCKLCKNWKNCNIQDGTIIHVSSYGFSARGRKGSPTILGNNVTVGTTQQSMLVKLVIIHWLEWDQ